MGDELTTYQRLAAPFADTHTKTISGRTLTYISGEQCTTRLNEVLGFDGWSFEVKDHGIAILEDEVWAVGRLTIFVDGRAIVREQTGGQIINRKSGTPATPARPAQDADGDRPAIPAVPAQPAIKGDVIELSNDIKGAVTDCMKKCASLVGVGLYLSERGAGGQSAATRPPARRNGPPPASPTRMTPEGNAAAQLTGAPPTSPPCNKQGFTVAWHTAVKRTRFDDGDTRHKFIAYHTQGKYDSLSKFLDDATHEQADALMRAISARIKHEAQAGTEAAG